MRGEYVKYKEVFGTNKLNRKEVRYYLIRRDGTSDLAVIGKQINNNDKKLGHNSNTTSFRYRFAIHDKLGDFPLKLRSRKDVIVFLTSLVTEFLWVGSSWACKKKRKHYEAYSRSGIRISVHDFVYVLAEEGRRLVAYLDDLYEDSRGNKLAVVRWFHKIDEVALPLPLSYNDKEIFFSPCLQDLSIKCIDGSATVLSPRNYKSFLKLNAHTILEPFVCRYQIDNEVVKPFDVTQLKGYWNQIIHKFISTDAAGIRPKKRLRRLVDGEYNSENRKSAENVVSLKACTQKHGYTIGDEIEVLSQDSGIKGMWFKATVIKNHRDKLKVRYRDIKDAADESMYLEEWLLSSRVADDDQLGIRHRGRTIVRPSRLTKKSDYSSVEVGSIVDAWLHDGWWEGIVVHKESDDSIHVYFPGEKQRLIVGCKDLRYSEEWLEGRWKQMKGRPDLLDSFSCTPESNSHDNASDLTRIIHEKEIGIGVAGKDIEVGHSKEDLLARLPWNWSTKKKRCYASNINNLVAAETRKLMVF
uniref:uncharacterized protein LOC122596256 n=1 Tax=Erigeron canadensis TaxID=72917 RepID=UPI001CB8CF47|nr:uncharacterized protein LOC122596256 [Erigeron canadensis]